MADLFLGIDIGTSGVRSVAFTTEGRQAEMGEREYPVIYKKNGGAEQDPELLFSLAMEAIRESVARCLEKGHHIAGMGFCSQMHSLMGIDREGNSITPLYTWADLRAGEESQIIEDNWDIEDLYRRTGCRLQHPMYPVSKILWLKYNDPDLFSSIRRFITIKDWVIYRLTGMCAVDMTNASCQGLYNIHSHTWDDLIISDILGIDTSHLAELADCTFIIPGLQKDYAEFLGLPAETPVALGTGDGIAANVGCGVRDSSSFSSSLGTSGAIRTLVERPVLDSNMRTWCYAFTDTAWVAGGAINNGGLVLEWLKNLFSEEEADSFAGYSTAASSVPPGCDGLMFLPFLTGERSPNWNAGLKGLLHGLDIHHQKAHLIRSAMEGVMFRLFAVYNLLNDSDNNVSALIANGGYTRSNLWLQVQADIFNKEIRLPRIGHAAALGAAFLSMFAQGAVDSIQSRLPVMNEFTRITPQPETVDLYGRLYRTHLDLYDRNAL